MTSTSATTTCARAETSAASSTSEFGGSMTRAIGGMRDDEFAGQSAIVTGGGAGIGRATALALASRGASVTLASRKVENLESVAKEIDACGGYAAVVPTD